MKYSVADFYRSQTMKAYFAKLSLPPAIECILINKSKHSIFDKIEALSERYEAYSDNDFTVGEYSGTEFKNELGKFINFLREGSESIKKSAPDDYYVLIVDDDPVEIPFSSFSEAIQYARTITDDDRVQIHRLNWKDKHDFTIYLLSNDLETYGFIHLPMCFVPHIHYHLPPLFRAGDYVKWTCAGQCYGKVQRTVRGDSFSVDVKEFNDSIGWRLEVDSAELISEDELQHLSQ